VRNDDIFRRTAPFAGMAGGLLLFAAAGVALVAGHVSAALIWLLVAAGLLLVFFVAADPDHVLQLLGGRQARYGSLAGVTSVLFLGIFMFINIFGAKYNQQWDFTQSGQFTLTSATTALVKDLQQPVQIIAFYTSDPNTGGAGKQDAQRLLARYSALSPKVAVTFVDPDVNPQEASQYHVTAVPTLVVTAGGKQEQVQTADEQSITSAIQKVTSGTTPKVYFLQGHGEPSLQATSGPSFSLLVGDLKKNNLDGQPLDLLTTAKVPADAAMVVEASPTTPYTGTEQQALLTYLAGGGRMLVMAGPFPKDSLDWLLKPYGVAIDGGLIADVGSSISGQPQAVVVQNYEPGGMLTSPLPPGVYLDTTALTVASPAPSGVTVTPVAKTSADSYDVTDPKANTIDPAKDKKGPFNIMVSVEKTAAPSASAGATPTAAPTPAPTPTAAAAPPTRLVVVGDTAFVTDQLLSSNAQIGEGNSEAAIAAMKWLTTQPGGVIIPTKAPADRSMVLLSWQQNLLIFANALFVPAIVLFAGLAVWFRRR
jgi:ABC-type uncharacterized transport system involved in gliding motility auxiliary subunit